MSRSCLNRPPNCAFAGRESVRWGTGPRKHSARARTCQALQSCTTIEALGEGRRGAAVSSKLGAARFGGGALAAALVATGRTAASRQASSSPYARSPATAAGCWLDSPMGCKLSATAPRVRVPRGKFPLQHTGVYGSHLQQNFTPSGRYSAWPASPCAPRAPARPPQRRSA